MFTAIRALSAASLISAIYFFKDNYSSFFLAFLFCHYLLAVTYASTQIGKLSKRRKSYLPLLATALAAFFTILFAREYVPIFIIVHVALSEVYMLNAKYPATWSSRKIGWNNLLRFTFNTCVLLILIRQEPIFSTIDEALIPTLGGISLLGLIWLFTKSRCPRDFYTYELLGLAVAGLFLLFNWSIKVPDLVFYHIITWFYLPLFQFLKQKNFPRLKNFMLVNTFVTAGFLTIIANPFFNLELEAHVPIFATLHILSSMALSRLNPLFVRRFFYPPSQWELREVS